MYIKYFITFVNFLIPTNKILRKNDTLHFIAFNKLKCQR